MNKEFNAANLDGVYVAETQQIFIASTLATQFVHLNANKGTSSYSKMPRQHTMIILQLQE
jgi:hypothetical protein